MFRQRPAELFFKLAPGAERRDHRPRAAGKRPAHRQDHARHALRGDDHRKFNRHGESFDVGETFSGVPYEEGLAAVEELRPLVPAGTTMGQFALRWILMFDEVTTVIPGAKTLAQARDNAAASDLPPIDKATMAKLQDLYDRQIKQFVHQRW